jgi:ABC-type bacteriocin/lantibiotic exporter with double-glycine peptidase domain
MSEKVIEIKDVSFYYKEDSNASLNHVNLQVKAKL